MLAAVEHRVQQDVDGAAPGVGRVSAIGPMAPITPALLNITSSRPHVSIAELDRGDDRLLVGDVAFDEPRRVAELGDDGLTEIDLHVGDDDVVRPPRRSVWRWRHRSRSLLR